MRLTIKRMRALSFLLDFCLMLVLFTESLRGAWFSITLEDSSDGSLPEFECVFYTGSMRFRNVDACGVEAVDESEFNYINCEDWLGIPAFNEPTEENTTASIAMCALIDVSGVTLQRARKLIIFSLIFSLFPLLSVRSETKEGEIDDDFSFFVRYFAASVCLILLGIARFLITRSVFNQDIEFETIIANLRSPEFIYDKLRIEAESGSILLISIIFVVLYIVFTKCLEVALKKTKEKEKEENKNTDTDTPGGQDAASAEEETKNKIPEAVVVQVQEESTNVV